MAQSDERFHAQLLWLISHFGSASVRDWLDGGALLTDADGNLSWGLASSMPGSGSFDYQPITDAVDVNEDYGLVTAPVSPLTAYDWGGV